LSSDTTPTARMAQDRLQWQAASVRFNELPLMCVGAREGQACAHALLACGIQSHVACSCSGRCRGDAPEEVAWPACLLVRCHGLLCGASRSHSRTAGACDGTSARFKPPSSMNRLHCKVSAILVQQADVSFHTQRRTATTASQEMQRASSKPCLHTGASALP
jgi:hypothetical protein